MRVAAGIAQFADIQDVEVKLKFFVPGIPVPKGSAKAFINRKTGRPIVTQDNGGRQKPWASMISTVAYEQNGKPIIDGPVFLSLSFVMPRPKSHFFTGKRANVLRPDAPTWHTAHTGDLDKLVRCVKDALTGVIWKDDCQVACMGNVSKVYGDRPGVEIIIKELEESKC